MPEFLSSMGRFLLTNWPLVLPLLLGAAAVFLLLPRPRVYPRLWGAGLGALALLLLGWLCIRSGAITVESLLFFLFAGLAVLSGGVLVTNRDPVHAALAFALVVLSTCGLFLLQAAPFLMAATIIVYAGAIVVTFLFLIMLAQQSGLSDADHRSREPFLATLAGFVLLGAMAYVLGEMTRPDHWLKELAQMQRQLRSEGQTAEQTRALLEKLDAHLETFSQWSYRRLPPYSEDTIQLATALNQAKQLTAEQKQQVEKGQPLDPGRLEESLTQVQATTRQVEPALEFMEPPGNKPLSPLSQFKAKRPWPEPASLPAENVAYLGRSLFTDYLLPVELAGFLLLVATVGAIVIAGRRPEGLR